MVWTFLAIAILTAITLGTLYLYFLAFYGVINYHRQVERFCSIVERITIIVPAHNEELSISTVIRSLQSCNYPPEKYTIVVVADNCSDSTAAIALALGTTVWERKECTRKGKGYALEWAIRRIDLDTVDAVAVIDADNVVEPDFLKTVAGMISLGYEVVQTSFGFFEVRQTAYSYLQYLSSLVENHLFYNPRSLLGFPCTLMGSGMVFKSSVLVEIPWSSHSITEDLDYSLTLLANGKIPAYIDSTAVYQRATATFEQAFGQRVRGSSGVIRLIRHHFSRLMAVAIKRRDLRLVEGTLSLLLLSRPLLIYWSGLALVLGLFGLAPVLTAFWSLILVLMLSAYLFMGVLLSPQPGPLIKSALLAPVFGLWLFFVQLLAICGFRKDQWFRTKRVVAKDEQ